MEDPETGAPRPQTDGIGHSRFRVSTPCTKLLDICTILLAAAWTAPVPKRADQRNLESHRPLFFMKLTNGNGGSPGLERPEAERA